MCREYTSLSKIVKQQQVDVRSSCFDSSAVNFYIITLLLSYGVWPEASNWVYSYSQYFDSQILSDTTCICTFKNKCLFPYPYNIYYIMWDFKTPLLLHWALRHFLSIDTILAYGFECTLVIMITLFINALYNILTVTV